MVYDELLSASNLQKIGSYLAIKWFTLSRAAANYLSTTSSTIWNATTLATYKHKIAGIGRDDNEDLDQLQSRNTADDFQITLALGSSIPATNSANTSTVSNDRSYLLWGDNGGSTNYTRTIVSGGVTYYSMSRTWIIEKTNWTDQNITLGQDSGSRSSVLLVATDAAFTHVTQHLSMTSGSITLNSSKIPNGSFVTFAGIIHYPSTYFHLQAWPQKTATTCPGSRRVKETMHSFP